MMRLINEIRELTRALYGQELSVNHVAEILDTGKLNVIKLRDELKKALEEEDQMIPV